MFSMPNSLCALSPISQQASTCFNKPNSRTLVKLKPSPGFTSYPIKLETFYQCLSIIPFFLKATKRGTFGLNSSNYPLTIFAMPEIAYT